MEQMKKHLISLLLLTACAAAAAAAARGELSAVDPLAGSGPFSDPVFEDCLETSEHGYLNAKNTMLVRTDFRDFRDSVVSAPPPSLKTVSPAAHAARLLPENRAGLPRFPAGHYKVTFAGESGPVGSYVRPLDGASGKYARAYVMLGVSINGASYDKLLPELEAAGLRFAGERISYSFKRRKTVILGWAPYSSMARISKIAGVAGVAVEKRSTGVPMKARVRFTLKVPFQNRPNAFVPGFIKRLSDEGGFTSESWFRLPQAAGESKFSVFDVTGTLPVDRIGELSRSPFVASVEFNDSSL